MCSQVNSHEAQLEPPLIYARFSLTKKDFDPEIVTKRIGLLPTRQWHRGELRGKSRLQHENCGWMFEGAKAKTTEVEQVLLVLLDQLESYREPIDKLRIEMGLDVEFSCVVYGHGEGSQPWVHLTQDTLSRLCNWNADFDLDSYWFPQGSQ